MTDFISIPTHDFDPFLQRIAKDWMLIGCGGRESPNLMTASWGFCGILWDRPSVICLIRPERYSYRLMETCDHFSVSFLPTQYREAMRYCGAHSGRHENKFAAAGLTLTYGDRDTPFPAEADEILICQKRYADELKPECFFGDGLASYYRTGGYHKLYVGEIVARLAKQEPSD